MPGAVVGQLGTSASRRQRWTARGWVAFGKFILAAPQDHGQIGVGRFIDELAEGILNRLVRAQLGKGEGQRENALLDSNRQRIYLGP